MKKRGGFSIMELVLGIFLIVIALVVFLSIFSNSSAQSMQTRNRTVAILLANSLLDEVEAHPYGSPMPPSWTVGVDKPVQVWVEGNQQEMDFHKKIECEPGSFVNKTPGDTDLVTITISWREGVGKAQPGVVDPKDNKVLIVKTPVWR